MRNATRQLIDTYLADEHIYQLQLKFKKQNRVITKSYINDVINGVVNDMQVKEELLNLLEKEIDRRMPKLK
jgi:hypothetical protein